MNLYQDLNLQQSKHELRKFTTGTGLPADEQRAAPTPVSAPALKFKPSFKKPANDA
jgi:hypothetical protein